MTAIHYLGEQTFLKLITLYYNHLINKQENVHEARCYDSLAYNAWKAPQQLSMQASSQTIYMYKKWGNEKGVEVKWWKEVGFMGKARGQSWSKKQRNQHP